MSCLEDIKGQTGLGNISVLANRNVNSIQKVSPRFGLPWNTPEEIKDSSLHPGLA